MLNINWLYTKLLDLSCSEVDTHKWASLLRTTRRQTTFVTRKRFLLVSKLVFAAFVRCAKASLACRSSWKSLESSLATFLNV